MGEDPPGDRRQQPRSPREPATNVSWTEIQKKFLPSLQKLAPAGFRFRLPTEAEWEQACRAGANTAWHSGDRTEDLEQAGWCRANSGGAARPVGSRAPNAWGLYDMHGNVAELCEDLYDSTFYLAKETEYPLNASEGVFRVVRGGSWANLPQHCRAAYRSFAHPDNRYDYLGLRVVLARLEGAVKP
jgi:formylglycine-generating enzyme required for sulfatase activity